MTSQAPVYVVAPARGRFRIGDTYLTYPDPLLPRELDDPVLQASLFYSDELNDVTDRVRAALRRLWRP